MNILKFLGIGIIGSYSYVSARMGVFGSHTIELNNKRMGWITMDYGNIQNQNHKLINHISYEVNVDGDRGLSTIKQSGWYIRPVEIIHTDLQGQTRRY